MIYADPTRLHILVPFLYTDQIWAGGAVYLRNLLKILSSLPEPEQPRVLLLDVLGAPAAEALRAAFQEPVVAGIFTSEGRPTALKPALASYLIDPQTQALRGDNIQRLLTSIDASFPVTYPLWGGSNLPNPIYWIPDFQHKRLPDFFSADERASRDGKFGGIAGSDAALLLSSRSALTDYQTYFPNNRSRNHVWSFCSCFEDREVTGATGLPAGLPSHFFYVANQFWAHKDHGTVFTALRLLRERGRRVELVCTGAPSDHRNTAHFDGLKAQLERDGTADQVHFLGVLPREQQIGLFRHAAAVIQPSLFEGWSTVVEDVRALGRPLVLSDIGVHQEQMKDQGLFFRAGNPEDLARVILENWSRFAPGPDLEAERRALAGTRARRQEAARAFMAIVAAEKAARTPAAAPSASAVSQPQPAAPAPAGSDWSRPRYTSIAHQVPAVCYPKPLNATEWYPPVMFGADHLVERLFTEGYVEQALKHVDRLDKDAYTAYLADFYREGLRRYGSQWRYADIVTVLLCAARHLQPRRYLEIGVRRGRSLSAVASQAPDCHLVAMDMWIQNYAGMENPGAEFVKTQLALVGHRGPVEFHNGNSHEVLPRYFAANPDLAFDLITVDGDHTPGGAAQDLSDVLPHLAIGGAIVFDDICHPYHPELREVWKSLVADDMRFSTWSYEDVGYGVGIAIRKH